MRGIIIKGLFKLFPHSFVMDATRVANSRKIIAVQTRASHQEPVDIAQLG
jgi:hypothetical protein